MKKEHEHIIAVVGMSGLFPNANDLGAFWQNIVNRKSAAGEIPKGRWIVDPDAIYDPNPAPDRTFSKRACLIRDFSFDSRGFGLDEELLNSLDPL